MCIFNMGIFNRIVSTVKKLGKELSRDTEMLGSYPPKNDFASIDIGGGEFMEAPTGMLARGEYKAEMKVILPFYLI